MAVAHVTFNGKRLPIKLGYYTLKMMQKEHNVSMEQLQGQFELYEPLLFYSLKQGHKVENIPFELTMEDMEMVLDDCLFEFIELIPSFFPMDLEKMMVGGPTPATKKGSVPARKKGR